MGTTKTEAYTAAQLEIAQLFKAIGHPARIAILEYLIQRKTCVCGEVVDEPVSYTHLTLPTNREV